MKFLNEVCIPLFNIWNKIQKAFCYWRIIILPVIFIKRNFIVYYFMLKYFIQFNVHKQLPGNTEEYEAIRFFDKPSDYTL
jgi:hypothetical protein